jgi:hypothetical protein
MEQAAQAPQSMANTAIFIKLLLVCLEGNGCAYLQEICTFDGGEGPNSFTGVEVSRRSS